MKFCVNTIFKYIQSIKQSILFFSFFLLSCEDAKEEICIDESKINPSVACPEIFAPVLGCDEKIYSNSCKAEKNGVRFWTEI